MNESFAVQEAPAAYRVMQESPRVKAGYKQTEVGVIPADWDAVPLSELGQFKNGINKGNEAFGHGSPFVNLMNVFGVSSITSGDAFGLVDTSIAEQKTYDIKRGDVIFIRSSVKPSGVGLTAVVETDLPCTVYSGFLIRFRDNSVMDIGFKRHCFYSASFRNKLIGASSVSANTNINQDNLKRLLLALPPLIEQRAIATALSDVDALLAAQDRLIAKKRDIKQAAMQQLLTGKQRLPGFSGVWEVKRLGDVAELKNGFAFKSSTYTELGQFKVVTIANVQDGYMTVDDCNKVADIPVDLQRHQKLIRCDILISMTGNVGRVCRVTDDDCLLNQRVGKLVPISIDESFFFSQLSLPIFSAEMSVRATGGAQGNLSKSDIVDYELAVPKSVEEQTAIAAVLSDMDADLAALEQQRDKTRALKQGMMQELLTGRIRLV